MTPTSTSKPAVPIIIGSCQRYAEVLNQVYASIKATMPNRTVRIVADVQVCIESTDQVLVMRDLGWNNNLLALLTDLPDSSHVIITMDDLLITWCDKRFSLIIDQLIQEDFDYVSLYAPPPIKLKRALETDFKQYSDVSEDHAISTMVSLIRVKLLRALLIKTVSPWEFEKRSYEFTAGYRCINLNYNLASVSNLIVKGKRIQWRNPEAKLGLTEKLFSVQYALKVLVYSFMQLRAVRILKFLLK